MGTRKNLRYSHTLFKDHPHAYGDKILQFHGYTKRGGSSPRVWGQVGFTLLAEGRNGIIPTRMGTSNSAFRKPSRIKDHPHAYGDKNPERISICTVLGSSPRVWGQVKICPCATANNRIIPTRMGTSSPAVAKRCITPDHPHAYGDKGEKQVKNDRRRGSSPRVWGQDYRNCPQMRAAGIIPTRMGTRLKKEVKQNKK